MQARSEKNFATFNKKFLKKFKKNGKFEKKQIYKNENKSKKPKNEKKIVKQQQKLRRVVSLHTAKVV